MKGHITKVHLMKNEISPSLIEFKFQKCENNFENQWYWRSMFMKCTRNWNGINWEEVKCSESWLQTELCLEIYFEKLHKQTRETTQRVLMWTCSLEFPHFSLLKILLKAIHQNVKKFRCTQCDKSFSYKVIRISPTHFVISYMTLYKCEICGKDFMCVCYLKKHIKVLHSTEHRLGFFHIS